MKLQAILAQQAGYAPLSMFVGLLGPTLAFAAAWGPSIRVPAGLLTGPGGPEEVVLAIVGGTVHDLEPGTEPRVATVLVRDGVIEAVGPDVEIPAGTPRVDATGKHVVPGLIDSFVGLDANHDALFVSHGITTIRDWGNDPFQAVFQPLPENRERTPGPAILTSLNLIDSSTPPINDQAVLVLTPADAERYFREFLFAEPPSPDEDPDWQPIPKPDFVHVFSSVPADVREAIHAEARANDLRVWGPRPRDADFDTVLGEGYAGLHYLDSLLPDTMTWEKVFPVAFARYGEQLADCGTALVPMVVSGAIRLEEPDLEDPLLRSLERRRYREVWEREWTAFRGPAMEEFPDEVEAGRANFERQLAALRAVHEAGAPLLPGSSAGLPWHMPGRSFHRELQLWQRAGIPAGDILVAATRRAAEVHGIADTRGTLRPGKVADLLVVAGDPREDIARLERPDAVVVRGTLLERADLDDLVRTLAVEFDLRDVIDDLPLEIEEPACPDGAPVLAGQVEIRTSDDTRISSERYKVVRQEDGTIAYCGRRVLEAFGGGEVSIRQDTRDGKLVWFAMSVQTGEGATLQLKAVESEGRWFVERRMDGLFQPSAQTPAGDFFAALEYTSVTTPLMLGQRLREGTLPAARIGTNLVPEIVPWNFQYNDAGQHFIDQHPLDDIADTGFALARDGSLKVWQFTNSGMLFTMTPVRLEKFGGAGLPLPAEKTAGMSEEDDEIDADFLDDEFGGDLFGPEEGAEPVRASSGAAEAGDGE